MMIRLGYLSENGQTLGIGEVLFIHMLEEKGGSIHRKNTPQFLVLAGRALHLKVGKI